MCTVTFIPGQKGYQLGMNRDEKLDRVNGLLPRQRLINGRSVLCPEEPGGGTWIALNESGASLALINWYSITKCVGRVSVSRGSVISASGSADNPTTVEAALTELPLKQINPFRLIGVFPKHRKVMEWQWNLETLISKPHRWRAQQWISSGFDEPEAQRVRGATFHRAIKQQSFGNTDWLRRLHGSHSPRCGPFSTCMHRSDAATVSYTEIVVSSIAASLRHHLGAPCKIQPGALREYRF